MKYGGNLMLDENPLWVGCNLTIVRGGLNVALIQIHGLRFSYRRYR